MTRGTARGLLRRRLQETTADAWADTDLNTLLTLGLQEVQKKILAVNPDAFQAVYRTDLVLGATLAGYNYYDWPEGFTFEYEVAILNESSGKYEPVDPKSFSWIRKRSTSETTVYYAHFGGGLLISPVPAKTIAMGLQLTFCPTLSLADDNSQPPASFPGVLHMAWVIKSEALAYGDTGEDARKANDEVDSMIATIPQFLIPSAAPQELVLDIPKVYE